MNKLKNIICLVPFVLAFTVCFAEQTENPVVAKPIGTAGGLLPNKTLNSESVKARKQYFKKRRKEMKKLLKKYKKAVNEADKQQVREEIYKFVSEGMDTGIKFIRERIALEKENLNAWEKKIAHTPEELEHIKQQRVEELLSGEAQKKFKSAKKRWKKQIKEAKKQMK